MAALGVVRARLFRFENGLLVFVLCFAAYLGNCRTIAIAKGGDTIPNRLIPFSILSSGTVTLDAYRDGLRQSPIRFYVQQRRGHDVSLYPIGTSLGALPVYVPIYAFLSLGGRPSTETMFLVSEPAEKLAAALITAVAVWVFWLTVRRMLSPRQAFWTAIAFGLGTSMWATASQMLWQQTVVAAYLTVALWLLTWPGFPRWAAAGAGAALSLAVASRPTAGLLFLAGLAATMAMARKKWLGYAVCYCIAAVPLTALSLGVNWYYYGHTSGFYDEFLGSIFKSIFTRWAVRGIEGLIISPNRGLLVFTPIALLGLISLARQFLRRDGRHPVLLAFGIAALFHLIISGAYKAWWGGWSFGPRYLVDILPVLALAAAAVWNQLPQWARRLAIAGLVWSILVQMNGAFCYPASDWNLRMVPDPVGAVHRWSDFELWQDFRAWTALHIFGAVPF